MNEDYLAHYQIKGAKHGVRRFQNLDGSLTPEGRARYGVGEPRSKSKTPEGKGIKKSKGPKKESFVKKAIANNKSKKEAKKAADEAEQHENMMKYFRKHPEKVYKHRGELTTDDVNRLLKEVEFDRKLKDLRDSEIQRGWNKVNNFTNNLGTLANLTNNSINTWNNTSAIYNALVENGVIKSDKRMPKVNR